MRPWFSKTRARCGLSQSSPVAAEVQTCEPRVLPAGTVTVVDSTDFVVSGDNQDNSVEIHVGDESTIVVPLDGTRLKVNGFTFDADEAVEFYGAPFVPRDAVVDMKGGHDRLVVWYGGGEIGWNARVSMGTGND